MLIKKLSVRCDKHKLCGCRACVYAKISVAPVSSDVFIFKVRLLVSFHESIIFLTACKQWLAYHDIVSSLCVHYLVKSFVYSHFLSKSVSMKCRTESHIAGRIFRKYSVFLVKVQSSSECLSQCTEICKRTAKEKESLWAQARADTAVAFLPVYDNLERALKQETADEAYKKGVEMTMNQLKEVFSKLGITEIDALGKPFDPNLHNAIMHVEDESFGENTVAEVFQAGFMLGEKVIRFAMVKVAN